VAAVHPEGDHVARSDALDLAHDLLHVLGVDVSAADDHHVLDPAAHDQLAAERDAHKETADRIRRESGYSISVLQNDVESRKQEMEVHLGRLKRLGIERSRDAPRGLPIEAVEEPVVALLAKLEEPPAEAPDERVEQAVVAMRAPGLGHEPRALVRDDDARVLVDEIEPEAVVRAWLRHRADSTRGRPRG